MIQNEKPVGFEYIETSITPLYSSSNCRGFSVVKQDEGLTIIGEDQDIVAYVQYYFFNEETGQLAIKLKDECVLKENKGNYPFELNKSVLYATDAVLGQLAIKTFIMLTENGEETFALLDGSKSKGICTVPGYMWCQIFYDKAEEKKINFAAIQHFAFDKSSYKLGENGNSFSIILSDKYRNHAGVLYALHDVLGRICRITRTYETALLNSLGVSNIDPEMPDLEYARDLV